MTDLSNTCVENTKTKEKKIYFPVLSTYYSRVH